MNEVELWREAEQHWCAALHELDECENTLAELGKVGQGLVALLGMAPVDQVMPYFALALPKEVRAEVAARYRQEVSNGPTAAESATDSAGA